MLLGVLDGVDDTSHAVVDDAQASPRTRDADAAADRVDRRRGLSGLRIRKTARYCPRRRRGHFLDMGERLADFVAAGDHDAAGIEDAESGQRDFLRFQDDRHQPGADLDIGG